MPSRGIPRPTEHVEPLGALAYYPAAAHTTNLSTSWSPTTVPSPLPQQPPQSAFIGARRGDALPPLAAPGSRAPTPRLTVALSDTGSHPSGSFLANTAPLDDVSAAGFLSFKTEVPYLKDSAVTPPRTIYQPPSILQLRNAIAVDVRGLSDFSNQQLPSISLSVETGEFAFHFQETNPHLREGDRADKLCPPEWMGWDAIAYEVGHRTNDPEETLWEESFWRDMKRARQQEQEQQEQRAAKKQRQHQRKALACASVVSTGGSLATVSTRGLQGESLSTLTPFSRQQSMNSLFGNHVLLGSGGTPPQDSDLVFGGGHRRTSSGSTTGGLSGVSSRRINNHHNSGQKPTSAQQTAKGFLRRARYNEARNHTPNSINGGQSLSPSATVRGVVPTASRGPGTLSNNAGGVGENGFRFPVPSLRSDVSTCRDLNSTVGSGSNLLSAHADASTPLSPQTVDAMTPRIPSKRSAGTTYDSGGGATAAAATATTTVSEKDTARGALPAIRPGRKALAANSDPPAAASTLRRVPAAAAVLSPTSSSSSDRDSFAGSFHSCRNEVTQPPRCWSPLRPFDADRATAMDHTASTTASTGAGEARKTAESAKKTRARMPTPGGDGGGTTALLKPQSPRHDRESNQSLCSQPSIGPSKSATVVVAPEPVPSDSVRQRRSGGANSPSVSRTESLAVVAAASNTDKDKQEAAANTATAQQQTPALKQPPAHLSKVSSPDAGNAAEGSAAATNAVQPLPPQQQQPPPPQQQSASTNRSRVASAQGKKSTSSPRPVVVHRREGTPASANNSTWKTLSGDGHSSVVNNDTATGGGNGSCYGMTEDSARDASLPTTATTTDAGFHAAGNTPVIVVRQHEAITPGRTPRRAKADDSPRLERETAYGNASYPSRVPACAGGGTADATPIAATGGTRRTMKPVPPSVKQTTERQRSAAAVEPSARTKRLANRQRQTGTIASANNGGYSGGAADNATIPSGTAAASDGGRITRHSSPQPPQRQRSDQPPSSAPHDSDNNTSALARPHTVRAKVSSTGSPLTGPQHSDDSAFRDNRRQSDASEQRGAAGSGAAAEEAGLPSPGKRSQGRLEENHEPIAGGGSGAAATSAAGGGKETATHHQRGKAQGREGKQPKKKDATKCCAVM